MSLERLGIFNNEIPEIPFNGMRQEVCDTFASLYNAPLADKCSSAAIFCLVGVASYSMDLYLFTGLVVLIIVHHRFKHRDDPLVYVPSEMNCTRCA